MSEEKYNEALTDQVNDAKYAYLDKFGILHCVNELAGLVERRGYKTMDITGYKMKCASGFPLAGNSETATLRRIGGELTCLEGKAYMTPALIEIYTALEAK